MAAAPEQNQCDDIRANLAAYALGEAELSAAERTHLADCAECRDALAGFLSVATTLPLTVDEVAPPAALRGRILSALHAELQQPDVSAAQPARGATTRPTRLPQRRSSWGGLRAAWALAAVAIIALLGWNITLLRQVETQRGQLATSRSNWHLMTALLNDADVQWYPVAGAAASGHLWANPQGDVACLVAQQLPPLATDQVYQVWLAEGDSVVSGGTFEPRDGDGWVLIRTDSALAEYTAVLVTVEARGGSSAPTGAPILQGALTEAGVPNALQRAETLRLITDTLR